MKVPRNFGELIDWLVADYDADRAVIADDVRKLLLEMAAHDVVQLGYNAVIRVHTKHAISAKFFATG